MEEGDVIFTNGSMTFVPKKSTCGEYKTDAFEPNTVLYEIAGNGAKLLLDFPEGRLVFEKLQSDLSDPSSGFVFTHGCFVNGDFYYADLTTE